MEARNAMITPVRTLAPDATIADAARLMAEHDVGAVPVVEEDRILGIVTDRDIAVRGIAEGLAPMLPVARIMTSDVVTCRDIAIIDDVLDAMASRGVRRTPICSADGKLVGIVSLSDLARIDWDKEQVAVAFADICSARRLRRRARQQ